MARIHFIGANPWQEFMTNATKMLTKQTYDKRVCPSVTSFFLCLLGAINTVYMALSSRCRQARDMFKVSNWVRNYKKTFLVSALVLVALNQTIE